MASILMINLPIAGHTNPTLPLTEMLVQRGHDVSYINGEKFRRQIENTGAEFIPYDSDQTSLNFRQKERRCFRDVFDTAINLEKKYDLLIYEMYYFPGIKIAEILGIPAIRQFSQRALNQKIFSETSLYFKLSGAILNHRVRAIKHAKYIGLTNNTLGKAIINDKPMLNIVYIPQIFQKYRESFGEDYLFAFPLKKGIPGSQKLPYEEMKSPIVYISLGSLINKKGFYKKCIRAFGGKDISVILNTGRIPPETLGEIPENIYAYPYVPQLEVLQHADAFLTHCGMNSINEAMNFAVPLVAMPIISDQAYNAERIVELGIGKKVSYFKSSGRQLYQTVLDVCNNEYIKSRCLKMQSVLEKETTLEEVVGVIEKEFSNNEKIH
ncbi:MAG: hypothetical protein LBB91_10800 [Clostridiales bacterium]|jgi:MGT family glycosyltransferase|nr:hypothetical protein [Clostridiales bacterium]